MGWKKYQKIYIYQIKKKILNADVENCGSFKSFGYIYIYIYKTKTKRMVIVAF